MKLNLRRFWWVSLFLGFILDLLFWKKWIGLNFPLFVMLCLLTGFALLKGENQHPNWKTYILLPVILICAWGVFVRREPLTVLLDFVFTLFAMSLVAVTASGGKWVEYGVLDYFRNLFRLWLNMWVLPIQAVVELHSTPEEKNPSERGRTFWQIVRGLLLAIPILAIFAGLLASADAVFNQELVNFLAIFKIENWSEYLFQLILILATAYALLGVYLFAARFSKNEKLTAKDQTVIPQLLGITESGIILGSVVVLFGFFVMIQFRYFFGGGANINLSGYTYAEYARRGFGELVLVAFGSYLLLLGLASLTRRETWTQQWVYHILNTILVALVFVILSSAYQRLVLYESAYGFSRLRTYTHLAIVCIAILLLGVLILETIRHQRAFALMTLSTAFLFILLLNWINVDAFIVRQNIGREVARQINSEQVPVELDERYFLQLSEDAVPQMVHLVQTASLDPETKDKISASLVCMRVRLETTEVIPWQSFNWARYQAERALTSVTPLLNKYTLYTNGINHTVQTPSGEIFDCSPVGID